jgi:hypothetical protein
MPRLNRADFEALIPVGFWAPTIPSPLRPNEAALPDPATLVDETWPLEERERIAHLLGQGEVIASYRGPSRCRLCGISNGSTELSDRVHRWPSGLGHYVTAHSVRLPESFLTHLTSNAKP